MKRPARGPDVVPDPEVVEAADGVSVDLALEWHMPIVQKRLESHLADPGRARPWPEVRAEIERRLLKS